MNEKKLKIIETAIKLFAEKGFYSTSIQEITKKSDISKGAFYLHFSSKEELLLSIFHYYHDRMRKKVLEVETDNLSPREKLIKQINVQFQETVEYRDFIIMYIREHVHSVNDKIHQYMMQTRLDVQKWYESRLIELYGEQIIPYIIDISILLEGIKQIYIKFIIIDKIKLDLLQLSTMIVKRLDNLVDGILKENEPPLLSREVIDYYFYKDMTNAEDQTKQTIVKLLLEMQKELTEIELDHHQREEFYSVIDFLLAEMKKEKPKKFIFQGMLAHFKGIEPLKAYRTKLAELLDVDLL
ncbi:helix-turn-helix domain-containing protein [Fictibacillus sp. Mic-4]|uniref:TetR/AcrR family transcriptional regulator n=1 Tax=Fictibacillus sp. Mic-4 TaxID=3132826 RepID=UPI003CF28009